MDTGLVIPLVRLVEVLEEVLTAADVCVVDGEEEEETRGEAEAVMAWAAVAAEE